VLTGLETVKICTAYRYKGKMIENYPANLDVLSECEPVYEELPGWKEDITQVRAFHDLPIEAQHYIERITQLSEIPLSLFSVGPGRDQTIQVRPVYA